MLRAMSLIDYTYCTRGYVDNATIIPVSPNASLIGCPNPGLNEQASLFPWPKVKVPAKILNVLKSSFVSATRTNMASPLVSRNINYPCL